MIKDQKEKNKISSVEELEVFKRSHQLTLEVYKITEKFPKSEKFGLISQMRRAAASIATNLIEGSHRLNRTEYRYFVGVAKGSAGELKYQFLLVKDLGYLSDNEYLTDNCQDIVDKNNCHEIVDWKL